MFPNAKALVVVLVLAAAVFYLFRPICLKCMSPQTFARRRMVWFVLTVVGFLSPAFWMYALVACSLLFWAGKKDGNPLGLYLMVAFAVPNARYYIPTPLIGQLFDLTQYRILSLLVVLPWVVRSLPRWRSVGIPAWTAVDTAMLAFLSIYVFTNLPYESSTSVMRRVFTLTIDLFVVLYAFSRLESRERIVDAMAAFSFSTLMMAAVAIVEWNKGWLLYTGLANVWGDNNPFSWLFRGDRLRTQAAAEGPLNLGYHLAIGLGFFLYLRSKLAGGNVIAWVVIAVFTVGLYTTSSRGPWLTAFIAALIYMLTRPHAARNMMALVLGGIVALGVLYFTPLKTSIIDRLPIIGTADQDTFEYRQQLATLAWQLIPRNPFFGDPFVTRYMESLRQGQGIIDLVNGYIATLLFTGWVGMTLQGFVLASAFGRAGWATLRNRVRKPDEGAIGAVLVACFVATLFYVGTAGFGPTTYMLTGLLLSYASLMTRTAVAPATPSLAAPQPRRSAFNTRSFG